MNKEIALVMLDRIKDAPYLDRVSGLVQTFTQTREADGGRTVQRKIPVTSFATFQDCADKPQPQIDMIPNSRYKSVLYFEDQGISAPTPGRHGFDYISKIRLVCWLNTNLIAGQPNMLMTAQILNDIVGKLCVPNPFNVQPFTRISVKVANIPNQDRGIFSKYDYDDAETQYLMPPFEYFAIDFNVYYTVLKDCLPPIETSLDPCSILNQIFPCQDWQPSVSATDYYTKILPAGTEITIPASEHNLSIVRGITALDADRKEVDLYDEIQDDRTIVLKSNIDFQNYKVIIF